MRSPDLGKSPAAAPEPEATDCRELSGRLGLGRPAWPSVAHSLMPSERWADTTPPLPTNAWWQNVVLGTGRAPVNVLPYLARAEESHLGIAAPTRTASTDAVYTQMVEEIGLSAVESPQAPQVVGYDDLSVTLRWTAGPGQLRTPLVRGMAYVTGRYRNATPKILAAPGLRSINGDVGPATGQRFELELENGQTWIAYTSEPITLLWTSEAAVGDDPRDVDVRVAVVTGDTELLDRHAAAIPTGGEVRLASCTDHDEVRFAFAAEGGPPLMMALPHHLEVLDRQPGPLRMATVRGEMASLVGDTWTLAEPKIALAFHAPRPVAPSRRAMLRRALASDAGLRRTSADTYFAGKQLAAMARLALIADELGEEDIAARVRTHLAIDIDPYLDPGGASVVYDRSWGGLVATGTQTAPNANFGAGFYNDHHFHYGYFVYAAAALARHDEDWAEAHADAVEALIRDYGNPRRDGEFPRFRTKDWFVGHSWAAGLFEFPDARNQESVSEAVNAWYAMALWGQVRADPQLEAIGRIATATELRSAHTYWQTGPSSSVYPAPFRDAGVVGTVWSLKAQRAKRPDYALGIQTLPFTPVTELLAPADWVALAYPPASGAMAVTTDPTAEGFRGLLVLAHAILDPQAAWDEVLALRRFDDGNTRTNSLYWVATRP